MLDVLRSAAVSARRRQQGPPTTKDPIPPARCIIFDLPLEILAEIFLHCLPPGEWGTLSTCDAPWLLVKVCRKWRGVALSTLELWSKLPFLYTHPRGGQLRLFKLYLEYSAMAPLSIGFKLPQHPDNILFVPLITPYLYRSQRLSIVYGIPNPEPFITQKHFPFLKNLKLSCQPPGNATTRVLQGQLTVVGLEGIAFPWAQLTKLSIQFSDTIEILALLRDCSSLEVFHLRSSQDGSPETPMLSESKAVHPRLRTIIFEDAPASAGLFVGLLGRLVAPALSTLEFIWANFIYWHECYTMQSILSFIRNSGAELTSLTLYKIECSLQGLLDLSALIPMVTKLDLYGIGEDLLQLLTIKADSPHGILFPHLERLVIRYHPTAHYDPELSYCSDMFHSRIYLAPNTTILETMSPLQHAEVHVRSVMDCSILDFGEFHRGRYDLQRLMQCLRSVYSETVGLDKKKLRRATGRRRGDLTDKERVIRFVNRHLFPAQRELGYYAGRLPAGETLRFFRKLETAFTALERYPITHVLEVLGNKVDTFMRAFSCIPETSFLHHPTYKFHIRAANFLKRWDPIIIEYHAKDRWVCEDDFMKVTSSHKVVHRRFVQ